MAADRPACARLSAVAPAGRSAASYTITRDTTPGVDMKKTRVWIPTHPATLQHTGGMHRSFVARLEANVERTPVDVLAIFSDTKMGARQFRVGLTRAVGREDGRARCPDRVHDAGEKIEHADIDHRLLARMVVAQEIRQLRKRHSDRTYIVAKWAVKGFAGMRVDESEPPKRRDGGRAHKVAKRLVC